MESGVESSLFALEGASKKGVSNNLEGYSPIRIKQIKIKKIGDWVKGEL